jgi:hypothetical protein
MTVTGSIPAVTRLALVIKSLKNLEIQILWKIKLLNDLVQALTIRKCSQPFFQSYLTRRILAINILKGKLKILLKGNRTLLSLINDDFAFNQNITNVQKQKWLRQTLILLLLYKKILRNTPFQ